MTELSCDILVVGSGAAGATLAATIAEESNASIVIAEKGPYFGAESFNQRELDMAVLLAGNGARATIDGAIPVAGGECVGGGTTVNYALSFDPIRQVWDGWKERFGLRGFTRDPTVNDYGVPRLNLENALQDVRQRCNVHVPADNEVNDNNQLFVDGCRRSGVSVRKFELNMQGCIGCGFCGQGCAYDAKRGTMVTFLQDALKRGVRLVHHCSIDEIVLDSSLRGVRAVGARGHVVPTHSGSRQNTVAVGPLSIAAKLIIVSAGSIETPALLKRSRVPDPFDRIGRRIILHPSLPIAGIFKKKLTNYRGITGAYYSDHFWSTHKFMFECLFDHPINAAFALPGFGSAHFELMRDFDRLAGFGTMLVDQSDDGNRVIVDEANGSSSIVYRLTEPDKARLRFAAARMVEVMLAAGAEKAILTTHEPLTPRGDAVFVQSDEARYCNALAFVPNETLISSAHVQASIKMSEDPRLGATNSRGELRSVRNAIVCDSSSFPTSCGANPMIAVMAMARYQGRRIAAEWARYTN